MRMKMNGHLDDEHMRLYEWNGAGGGTPRALPPRPTRSHPWQASSAVLALLTTLLILNACDNETPLQTADEQVEQAVEQMREELRIGMLETGTAARPGARLGSGPRR